MSLGPLNKQYCSPASKECSPYAYGCMVLFLQYTQERMSIIRLSLAEATTERSELSFQAKL